MPTAVATASGAHSSRINRNSQSLRQEPTSAFVVPLADGVAVEDNMSPLPMRELPSVTKGDAGLHQGSRYVSFRDGPNRGSIDDAHISGRASSPVVPDALLVSSSNSLVPPPLSSQPALHHTAMVAIDGPPQVLSSSTNNAHHNHGAAHRRKVKAVSNAVLCEDNLKQLGRLSADQRIVQDPGMYRPATPILEWQTPKRSAQPPKVPMWLLIAICCAVEMIITGVVPHYLSSSETTVFLCVFIPTSTVITSFVTYMSITRHLQDMVELMKGINAPIDMDRVVEKLENGRFSRLREPWFVQVHTIRMFCRLLKYHHGVNPVSGEVLPKGHRTNQHYHDAIVDVDEEGSCDAESLALHSCFSGVSATHRLHQHQPPAVGELPRRLSSPVVRRLRPSDPLNDNGAGWDQVMGAPPENKNIIFEMLKQIKPGVDMAKIPLPAHVLEPRSVLERISDMFVHPDLFGRIAEAPNPKARLMALLQWYVSSFHVRPKGLKKPYNPVLGETFECYFAKGGVDEVHFFAEQVGHHPPVSIFTAVHTRTGLSITGCYMMRGRLVTPNTASITIEGRLDLTIPLPSGGKEQWLMSFPNIFISSLLSTPRIEAGGDVKFSCPSTDMTAELTFLRKPFFGGAYDEVKGSVAAGRQHLYTIGGKWSEEAWADDGRGQRLSLFDNSVAPPPLRPFAPDTAFPAPSRVIWEKVTVALRAMRSDVAQQEKNELEAAQREIRRAREARGEEYLPKYFRILDSNQKSPSENQWLYIGPSLVGAQQDGAQQDDFDAALKEGETQ